MNGRISSSAADDHRWQWPIDVTARVLPFAVFIACLLAADLAAYFVDSVGGWDARWLPVTRGLLVGMLLLVFHRLSVELRGVAGTSPKAWLTALPVGICPGIVPVGPDGRLDVTLATPCASPVWSASCR